MKKIILLLITVVCILVLVSCKNDNFSENNDDGKCIFRYALPTGKSTPTISNISNTYLKYATITQLYLATSDEKSYIPGMAKSMPQDVTSEYVDEKWNIKEGDVGRAWKIELRDDLCWENGDRMTAQDFIDTIVVTYDCTLPIVNATSYTSQDVESGRINISDLGIKVVEDALVLICSKEYEQEELCSALYKSSFMLVDEDLYYECYAKNPDGTLKKNEYGNYTNSYGTSTDKYMSYGPYKLTKLDNEGVKLTRNENWFGYKDLGDGYYQTDEIIVDYLEDYSTSYDLLVEGKYDRIYLTNYLDACNKKTYDEIDEKYIQIRYYRPFSKILAFIFDYHQEESNGENNITILSIKEFRQALLYSLDLSYLKDALEKEMSMYYYYHPFYTLKTEVNPYTGEFFHDSEEFQEVIEQYYSKFTGSSNSKERAIELFNEAYNIALNKGYLTENDQIYISFGNQRRSVEESEVILNRWKDVISETNLKDKVILTNKIPVDNISISKFHNVIWSYPQYYENFAIDNILTIKEDLGFLEYRNEEFSIRFDKVIDINGKEYKNVSLITSIGNWINGFKDNYVKTNIVIDGIKTDEVTILYEDNASLTNKIMAECEVYVLSDYSLIPTLDIYDPVIISDRIKYNYAIDIHYIAEDFRYITYN